MKAVSNMNNIVFAAVLACLTLAGSGSAFAGSVTRNLNNQTFTGLCCTSYKEKVSVQEPATLAPVVVTFSSDYRVNLSGDQYHVGLSVNGGPCNTLDGYGPQVIADSDAPTVIWSSATIQWVILPTDGVLVEGTNTFELCGGGLNDSSDSITIGQNTLSATVR